jgi:dihydroorotase
MSRIGLRQVRFLDPLTNGDEIVDVFLEAGIIQAIAPQLTLPEDSEVIEGAGLVLGPGLVDLYSTSGEPGHEERETLESLLACAAAGGFTRVAILPNTVPPLDQASNIQALRQREQLLARATQLYFWGALSHHLQGEQMTELGDLLAAGVVGFSDGLPQDNLGVLRRILEYLQPVGCAIALPPANSSLQGKGVMREGEYSLRYGLPGNAALTETTAIAALLEMLVSIPTPIHLMRVSTARGVALIAQARAQGLPVTASTTWLHLLLDTTNLADYNPYLRLEPPLGNPEDRLALIQGVKAGVIGAIAVDHTPYTYEEKTVAFAEAPPGAIGLPLALPLLWHHLVKPSILTPLELWRALSLNPLQCLKKEPISCAVGAKAELILFAPEQLWTVERGSICSLSQNTFWWEQTLTGKVINIFA